jgi:chaperonin GroEL
MANRVILGDEAREKVMRGIRLLADAVKSTLGPGGRNALLVRPFGVAATRDGVTVAKEIELEDPLEQAGARLLRMVAASADESAGDGTTTAVVLAEAILNEGMKLVAAGVDRMRLAAGVSAAAAVAQESLAGQAVPADHAMIQAAATVSLHGETELGILVADAIDKVGPQGMITTEDAVGLKCELEHQTGYQWEQGWTQQGFVNSPERSACVLEEPLIFLSERPLIQCNTDRMDHPLNLMRLLESVAGTKRPLLIVAESVDGDALRVLAANIRKGTLESCCAVPPGFGAKRKEHLKDLAIATGGGEAFSSEMGHDLSRWTAQMLGSARRAIVLENRTILIEPSGDTAKILERAEQLRALRGATDDPYEEEQFGIRIGRLTDGAVVLKVAAATGVELRERKDRLQDAVFSARAAAEGGIVAGGGVALVRAARAVEAAIGTVLHDGRDERLGWEIVVKALRAPLRQIAANAGEAPDVVLNEVMENLERSVDGEQAYGFNAETHEYEDLVEAGVVDPLKVTQVALEKAASIAGLLLTTEAVVCTLPAPAAAQGTVPVSGR